MSRDEFGQLVAALREELGWTQADLAEVADLDAATVSNIERGAKKQLDPELMSRLAIALQLTTGERRQFFVAASGLDDLNEMLRADGYQRPQAADPDQVLDSLVNLTAHLRVPCLLVDGYQDMLALNGIILELFKGPRDFIESWRGLPGGFTTMMTVYDLLKGPDSPVTGNWEASALANMCLFRERSLPYRARPYFKFLMREFRNSRKYPSFQRHWRLASTLPEDQARRPIEYSHLHPSLGQLTYHIFSATTNTPFGDLYLSHLTPADPHTAEAFRQVAERTEPRAVRMASWPEKKIPT